jgi:tetratricopeptide (TPR) repeat protein
MASQDDEAPSAAIFLREIETLLRNRKRRDAYQLAGQAAVRYENDPFLLSYFGYLEASVEGRYRNGIDTCSRAIALLAKKAMLGEDDAEESQLAPLYLNLGRAYIAAEKRMEAIKALNAGLKYDKQNKGLLGELERLGIRRFIPVPFLNRANPVNKIIGRMLRKKRAEERSW